MQKAAEGAGERFVRAASVRGRQAGGDVRRERRAGQARRRRPVAASRNTSVMKSCEPRSIPFAHVTSGAAPERRQPRGGSAGALGGRATRIASQGAEPPEVARPAPRP